MENVKREGIDKNVLKDFASLSGIIKKQFRQVGANIDEKVAQYIIRQIDNMEKEVNKTIENKLKQRENIKLIEETIKKDVKFKVIYNILKNIDDFNEYKALI